MIIVGLDLTYGVKRRSRRCTCHLSHFTPSLPMSPLSCLGREPPETATVNLPFFCIDSFWALMMKWARDSMSSSGLENEYTTGAEGWWPVIAVYTGENYLIAVF